jgi:hypothetical protein
MWHSVRDRLAFVCTSFFACACSSADGSATAPAPGPTAALTLPASEAALLSSAAPVPSGASPEDETVEREPVIPAAVPALPAPQHEARCTERRDRPSRNGTHTLLVDRGDSRERWVLSDSSADEGSLELESIDAAGSAFRTREFQFASHAATLRAEWTRHYDAKRRLVGVEYDGQPWLKILAWDGEVPEGFQSLTDQPPFGFDLAVPDVLSRLVAELEVRRHEVPALTSGASKVWSAYGHAGVEIVFDRGRPSLWNYSPISRTMLCAYEWLGTRLTKVRCADGNDSEPPPDGLPPGSEDFSWMLRWDGSGLVGISHRNRAGVVDLLMRRDAQGRIVELSNPEEQRRLAIKRDLEGRVVREEAWDRGTNELTTTTRFTCPAVLPQLPPLAPP